MIEPSPVRLTMRLRDERGDDGIDEVAAKGSKAREDTVLVGAGEPAVADDVRDQDRRELSGLAHCSPRTNPEDWHKNYRPNAGLLLGTEKVE